MVHTMHTHLGAAHPSQPLHTQHVAPRVRARRLGARNLLDHRRHKLHTRACVWVAAVAVVSTLMAVTAVASAAVAAMLAAAAMVPVHMAVIMAAGWPAGTRVHLRAL